MNLTNTIKALNNIGKIVVDKSKRNLRKGKKTTRSNTLYNEISYKVFNNSKSFGVEWDFGDADDYWEFVDQGVRGSGGYKGKGGIGRARGMGSKFKFKKKNIKKGVVLGWIRNKPLRLRGAKGRFIPKTPQNLKSAAFLIGRAIAQRGLTRTLFFTKPYEKTIKEKSDMVEKAFMKDLDKEIEKQLNN